MPSPFPGMNPYLEQDDAWEDFHQRFITFAAGHIEAQVGSEYIVKIEQHLYLHERSADQRRLLGHGDVSVARLPGDKAEGGSAAVLDAPVQVLLPAVDVEREAFLEIRDRRSRQVVTVVEMLSPANKRKGPDRDQYLAKRQLLLAGPTHFVEIDLLRGWDRMPIENLEPCDYCALVSTAENRPRAGLWPFRLRGSMPVIPIPLRGSAPAVTLELKRVLDYAYDQANYQKYIYESDPQPPLNQEDAAWARQFVPAGIGG